MSCEDSSSQRSRGPKVTTKGRGGRLDAVPQQNEDVDDDGKGEAEPHEHHQLPTTGCQKQQWHVGNSNRVRTIMQSHMSM